MRSPKGPRDLYAGPEDGPEPPFPIKLSGPVIKGFGRGSRELGIPTANIPPTGLAEYPTLESGVYFGFVGLRLTPSTTQAADNSKLTLSSPTPAAVPPEAASSDNHPSTPPSDPHPPTTPTTAIYPAVLSIGYNPFYANKTRSIEIHILHHFAHFNFYHAPLNLLVLGFIRPEYDYESLEDLVRDIKVDCEVARRSLEREGYRRYGASNGEGQGGGKGEKEWLTAFDWVEGLDVNGVEGEVLGTEGGKGVDGEGEGEGEGEKGVEGEGAKI